MPNIVAGIACSAGLKTDIQSSTVGGYRFFQHSSNANTLALIASQSWDYVVLQNQSQVPGWKPADVTTYSLPYAQTLVQKIKESSPNGQIIYYQTWGRETGDANNCSYYPKVCTFSGHTDALIEGYQLYQTQTGGSIAEVGKIWRIVANDSQRPFAASDLWTGDGSHPDILGSYLVAITMFTKIFQRSPNSLFYPSSVSQANARYIQEKVAADFGF